MMIKGLVFENSLMYALVLAYCEGKGYWWNVFFGFREINKKGHAYFILPHKVWKNLEAIEDFMKF